MLFSTSTIALVAALLPATLASPMQKRMTAATIQSYRTGGCLSLPAGVAPSNGALLITTNCATATKWDINYGSGSVIVSGTNFALDAGVPQGNNAPGKVWQSYPGSPQQTWYLTNDNRIAVTGGNQCLDQGTNGPQTYQCTTGNTNQIWYVSSSGTLPPTTTSTTTSTTTTTTSTTTSTTTTSPSPSPTTVVVGRTITWAPDTTKCLTVNSPANGAAVNLQTCGAAGTEVVTRQRFVSTSSGQIQLANTNYCLDAQSNPSNGGQLQVWMCNGNPQQRFSGPVTAGLIQTSNNQCIDVDNANNVRVQTWQCSAPDPQQKFNYAG